MNFNARWSIGDQYDLRFGIDNLMDEDPEFTNYNPAGGDTNSNVTSPGLYDVLGRRYYLGIGMRF